MTDETGRVGDWEMWRLGDWETGRVLRRGNEETGDVEMLRRGDREF